jgi:hypothetical protein
MFNAMHLGSRILLGRLSGGRVVLVERHETNMVQMDRPVPSTYGIPLPASFLCHLGQ